MKFGIMFANAGPFADPELFAHLVTTADAAGIESLWTVEHVIVPRNYQSTYPYAEGGKMPGPENSPIPDPFVALSYAAAITRKIRLATGVLILPQRHPAYVAKEVASLDVLSGGRVTLGIGVGWLREEFEALGIDFEDRAARTRDSVEAMRSLWSPGPSTYDGKFFKWSNVESNPKPLQGRDVPIVVGGHSDIAARRAARYGNGFFPGRGNSKRLAELIGIMRDECAKVGRNADTIEITGGMMVPDAAAIDRHEEMGFARLVMAPPGFDKDGISRGFDEFAKAYLK
ncbi:MAG: LLM class F420-dependent oxidoreductase [Candidatus Binatia bacterium]